LEVNDYKTQSTETDNKALKRMEAGREKHMQKVVHPNLGQASWQDGWISHWGNYTFLQTIKVD